MITILLSVLLSIPLGVAASLYQNRWLDYLIRSTSIAGHALPSFWLAMLVLLVLSVWLSWSPPIFYTNLWDDPWAYAQKAAWPAIILAWGFSSNLIRVTRSNMLEVLRQDYVRTARSKGLPERLIVYRHALRNALLPIVTVVGIQVGTLLSGAVVLEGIFGLPGLGQGIVLAANVRDYPVIQSLTMLMVATMLGLNLIVDLIYAVADPRVRFS